MTEAEWLHAEQLDELMIYLNGARGQKLRERKRRLLNCACARRTLHLLEDERFVVTGYFTKNIKKGTELWTS